MGRVCMWTWIVQTEKCLLANVNWEIHEYEKNLAETTSMDTISILRPTKRTNILDILDILLV